MSISKLLLVTMLGALTLAACDKKETTAETRSDVADAAAKGAENVAEAKNDAAEVKQEAAEEVAEANADVELTAAKAAYKVEIERCEAQTGNMRDSCKNMAKATLDAAQARADAKKKP